MNIMEQMNRFSERFGKQIVVNNTTWHYYRLGAGTPIFWLPGGLRRAAFGFAFLERLAMHHTVIAPDYLPVQTNDEYIAAFDAILEAEGIDSFALGGQSYGGGLAQVYLTHRVKSVERLILSSTGPGNYPKTALPALNVFITLARFLPEKTLKRLMTRVMYKFLTVPEAETAEWREAINTLMQNDLSRADIVSHFAVAADRIYKDIVKPAAYQNWTGRVIVLSSENDPTQRKNNIPRYEQLLGRAVEMVNMGDLGHTSAFSNPGKYVEFLEQALV
jgi:pimeloyl-ACP methyl ester carboxylesterase